MSMEESLKRKSSDLESLNTEEKLNEPQMKVQKTDTETKEHNLKNTEEINLIKISDDSKANKCSEEENIDNTEIKDPQKSQCSINIKFEDSKLFDLYKSKFLKFLDSFAEFEVKLQDNFSIEIYKKEVINLDECVILKSSKIEEITNVVEITKITNNVDTNSSANKSVEIEESPKSTKKRKKRSKVKKELFIVDATPSPHTAQADLRYTTKFTINTEKVEDVTVERPSRQTCFNCDQFHALKDCPLPKDYVKINLARQKFRQQPKSSRYHLEEEQKFSHLVPGKLSNELRKAMGLHRNEAPHYIYLMRRLGYPPGWLEEAKFVHSNLEMYDIHGNYLKNAEMKKNGLDPEKVVDFPGFNVPFEKGMKDDYRKYGVPPYSDDFSKEAMINFFDKKITQQEDNLETCDMDIDHEQESVGQEKEEKKSDANEDDQSRDSPSLLDLEQQKKQLLEELKEDTTKEEKTSKEYSAVRTTTFGTPILKSSSPYSNLPHPDKFSKDVSPVINFENLPNSTGKYEQMTDVLQKVRTTLKKIHSCNT